jgi:uncharacterized membrane protein
MMEANTQLAKQKRSAFDPFRRAVFGGLAVVLPPLLTIVIFLWVANTINSYLLEPMVSGSREILNRHYRGEIQSVESVPAEQIRDGRDATLLRPYQKLADDQVVPAEYYDFVVENVGRPIPQTSDELMRVYVERRFLSPYVVIPTFLCLFVLVLYLLGKFLAAGIGRIFWIQFEKIINRLPLIRNVYSSVKQVTDFMFTEQELEYTRVVAVEYPRKGIWTIAFATGESLGELRELAGEPVLALLIPTSPMPFTGFTITVKKSETVDLNISLDQAFQFIVSCGVVAPPQLISEALAER